MAKIEGSEYACGGGAEVGVDWVNELVIHEGDSHWHADAELFDTP